MHQAAIALGSNLPSNFGETPDNLRKAIVCLGALGHVAAVSALRTTEPVGYLDQPRFVNAAVLLLTDLPPLNLLRGLLQIEREMGRVRKGTPAKGPRIIDLDLIFYDDVVMESAELIVPHPAMRARVFVLEPLVEIAPDWRDPLTGLTSSELLAKLSLSDESPFGDNRSPAPRVG